MKTYRDLTAEEARIILRKGTEMPYAGEYTDHFEEGVYHCKQCDAALYNSSHKFHSGCGWPAFDAEIAGAVRRHVDADGVRTEITCVQCGGHLGHVFEGERFTDANTRHCVNSLSMLFVPTTRGSRAYFAGGCFWGVEHLLQQQAGVLEVRSGYMGGETENPTYKEVCYTDCGHIEAVEVLYDSTVVDYETLAKLFFEIHDPTEVGRQGPDVGEQYRSAVFYTTDEEKDIVTSLVAELGSLGYDVATILRPFEPFWPAEEYHQDYYLKSGNAPYCHRYTKRFKE